MSSKKKKTWLWIILIVSALLLTAYCLLFIGKIWYEPSVGTKAENIYDDILRVAAEEGFDPYSYTNSSGVISGYDVETAITLANRLKMNVEITLMSFDECQKALTDGSADIVMNCDPESTSGVLLTIPTSTDEFVIFSKNTNQSASLSQLKIAVKNNSSVYRFLCDIGLEKRCKQYDSDNAAMQAVEDGVCDAAAMQKLVGNRIIDRVGYKDISLTNTLASRSACIGITGNNSNLLKKMNEVLLDIKNDGTLNTLDSRWLAISSHEFDVIENMRQNPWILIAFAAFLFALIDLLARMGSGKASSNERSSSVRKGELNTIVNALSEQYEELVSIDMNTDKETVFRTAPWLRRKSTAKSYSEMIHYFAEQYVVRADRDRYLEAMDKDVVRNVIRIDKPYTVRFRVKKEGQIFWYEELLLRYKQNSIIMGLYSVDDEVRQQEAEREQSKVREIQEIVNGLAEDYTCVIYVDPVSWEDRIYRLKGSLRNHFPDWGNTLGSFETHLDQIKETLVYPGDREEFQKATDKKNILGNLVNTPAYFYNFRVREDTGVEYWQLKFTLTGSEDTKLIVGIHNVDREIREEQARRKEVERLVEVRTAELRQKNEALNRMSEGAVELLGQVVESRDAESGEHIKRVKRFAYILAESVMRNLPEYGITEEQAGLIASAASLHDVGKISIPDSILLKPGKLTEEEIRVMHTHCEKGTYLLRDMTDFWNDNYLNLCCDICMYHHERWDGSGYPLGLTGDNIPISAQIVAVADCYDALTAERVYKDSISPKKAINMILNGECGAFSEKLMKCLSDCSKEFELACHSADKFSLPDIAATIYKEKIPALTDAAVSKMTNEQQTAVISGLLKEYDFIFHNNLKSKAITPFQISKRFKETYPSLSKSFIEPGDLDVFFKEFVTVQDFGPFMAAMEKKALLKAVDAGKTVTHRFRGNIHDRIDYFNIKVVRDNYDPDSIVVGIIDVDEIVSSERRFNEIRTELERVTQGTELLSENAFADLFLNPYVSAYYINLKDRSMIVYKRSGELTDKYGSIDDYLESINTYINNDVYEDDREIMLDAVQPDKIRERLKVHHELSYLVRDISGVSVKYYRFIILRGLDDDHCVFGFLDMSSIDEHK